MKLVMISTVLSLNHKFQFAFIHLYIIPFTIQCYIWKFCNTLITVLLIIQTLNVTYYTKFVFYYNLLIVNNQKGKEELCNRNDCYKFILIIWSKSINFLQKKLLCIFYYSVMYLIECTISHSTTWNGNSYTSYDLSYNRKEDTHRLKYQIKKLPPEHSYNFWIICVTERDKTIFFM